VITVLISVVQIGNSRGIRLPKSILEQCDITDKVELEVHDKEITLKSIKNKARDGWSEKFKAMAENGDDKLVIDDSIDIDMKNWEW
jgi:antitoxin MazE